MNRKIIFAAVALMALLLAGFGIARILNSNSATDKVVCEGSSCGAGAEYALEEVARHSVKQDCWIAINRSVYNATGFISLGMHGPAILQGCGKDATSLYETRPMGSGTPHSANARVLLKKYRIGSLKE